MREAFALAIEFPSVPVDAKRGDWPRLVANAIQQLQNIVNAREAYPFVEYDADPTDPQDGLTYRNTTTGKVRTYSGGVWNDLF